MCRNPSGPHGGITLASRVFPGSQHCSVFNSFNLVRVPRRLHSPCHSHRSRTTQRHQVPRSARSRHSVLLSLIFRWASLAMSVHRRCHCVLCLQHTTPPQQTPLRNSPSRTFCSCVLPNTPSGAQFHSDFMKTSVKHRRPPATQETGRQSRSPMPPRSCLSPSSSSGASSPELLLPPPPLLLHLLLSLPSPTLLSRYIYSGFPTQCRFRRRCHPTPAHRVLSWVRLF